MQIQQDVLIKKKQYNKYANVFFNIWSTYNIKYLRKKQVNPNINNKN